MQEPNKIDFLLDGKSSLALVDKMVHDHALKVANAARASYDNKKDKFEEKDKRLTGYLWEHEHTSPFRHSYYTLEVELPIYVARQLMKYQVGSGFRSYEINGEEVSVEALDHLYDNDKGCSWNETSGRYTQTSENYYIPKYLRSNPGHGNKQSSGEYENMLSRYDVDYLSESSAIKAMEDHCKASLKLYHNLIKNGVAKEVARMILPQTMYTKAYWTLSLQSVIWFLHQRLKPDAQFEIRKMAEALWLLVADDLERMGITKENI
tara:strand:+ start:81728 stop:82519 length:792 start_codon:yes stop_codon:yes gene_type:complete